MTISRVSSKQKVLSRPGTKSFLLRLEPRANRTGSIDISKLRDRLWNGIWEMGWNVFAKNAQVFKAYNSVLIEFIERCSFLETDMREQHCGHFGFEISRHVSQYDRIARTEARMLEENPLLRKHAYSAPCA